MINPNDPQENPQAFMHMHTGSEVELSFSHINNNINAAAHMNPLEKEFLIRRYRSNQRVTINGFCESNGITVPSLRKWMRQYDEGGLEGLARADAEIKEVLPEGVDRTEESYKREILKLRIENERLKKSYAVQVNADGEREYVRLRPKSSR